MRKLKEHEQRVLDFIQSSLEKNGYAPSVRDIMNALGYKSTSTVHLYLHRLEEFGYIHMEEGKSRAITVEASFAKKQGGVPILGRRYQGDRTGALQALHLLLERKRIIIERK